MSRLLSLLLCLLPVVALAEKPPQIAILAVEGPSEIASRLALGLPRARRLSRSLVIGPAELQTKLRSVAKVRDARSLATTLVHQADQALTQMEREVALDASRRALALLAAEGGRYHSAELMVRARLVQAQAWLLQPEQKDQAVAAARAALQIDPELRPDLKMMSPRVAELLQQARADLQPAKPPSKAELQRLSVLAEVQYLVWIEATASTTTTLVFDRSAAKLRRLHGASEPETIAEQLAEAIGLPAPLTITTTTQPVGPKPGPTGRPWYKRWWVWTLAGAVLAGAGVTTYVMLRGDNDPTAYDLTVRFR